MFGIRGSNVSYKKNLNLAKNQNGAGNLSNISFLDDQEDIYKSEKFIFYDDKKKFTNQIEIYVSINNYNNKKLLIIIDSDSKIEELNNQICQSICSIPEFKDINGVRVEEVYKTSNNNKIPLPEE